MESHYSNIVLAIPHAVGHSQNDIKWMLDSKVAAESKRWTDWWTDDIFDVPSAGLPIAKVMAQMSRFDCDCERLEGEDERICRFANCAGDLSLADVAPSQWNRRLAEWFRYRAELMLAAAQGDRPLIIDCHSFPEDFAPDVDIDIGFNDDASRPTDDAIELVAGVFEDDGFCVAFNRPYANAISPVGYRGHSLMIEVNKHCYFDANGDVQWKQVSRLRLDVEMVCRNLLDKPISIAELANRYNNCGIE